jgi:hypothetical protein
MIVTITTNSKLELGLREENPPVVYVLRDM